MQLQQTKVDKVVKATCIPPNYLCRGVDAVCLQSVTEDVPADSQMCPMPNQGGNARSEAFVVRDKFMEYFNSPVGSFNSAAIAFRSARQY